MKHSRKIRVKKNLFLERLNEDMMQSKGKIRFTLEPEWPIKSNERVKRRKINKTRTSRLP